MLDVAIVTRWAFGAPLPEAYGQFERDLIEPEDFRRFIYENALACYGTNPDFFAHSTLAHGTVPRTERTLSRAAEPS